MGRETCNFCCGIAYFKIYTKEVKIWDCQNYRVGGRRFDLAPIDFLIFQVHFWPIFRQLSQGLPMHLELPFFLRISFYTSVTIYQIRIFLSLRTLKFWQSHIFTPLAYNLKYACPQQKLHVSWPTLCTTYSSDCVFFYELLVKFGFLTQPNLL